MKWVKERDLLIAQTMAFVQSVSSKRPVAEIVPQTEIRVAPSAPEKILMAALAAEPAPVERILEISRMAPLPQSDLRQEIQSRVASFRAHQQRFHNERDEFFSSKLAQVRAAIKNEPKMPPA